MAAVVTVAVVVVVVATAVMTIGGTDRPAGACLSGLATAPRSSVHRDDNQLVTDGTNAGVMEGGALVLLSADERNRLEASGQVAESMTADEFAALERRPRDGAVFDVRDDPSDLLYVSIGGAIFPTTRSALDAFEPNAVTPVEVTKFGISDMPRSPRTGTLVRIRAHDRVWLISKKGRTPAGHLCTAPYIVDVPDSPKVLRYIARPDPGRPSATSTTTPQKGATLPVVPSTLPDPGLALTADTCRRSGDGVLVAGSLRNDATVGLDFTVDVRVVTADGRELGRTVTPAISVAPGGSEPWTLTLDQVQSLADADHCEYLVESRKNGT